MNNTKMTARTAWCTLAIAVLGAAQAPAFNFFEKDKKTEASTPPPAVSAPPAAQPAVEAAAPAQTMPGFAPIVKKVAPSVVNIFTTTKGRDRAMPQHPLMNDPFFRRFFGVPDEDEDMMPQQPGRRPRQQQQMPQPRERSVPGGLGSGVIVSPDGYILTNNHVVERADEIKVKTVGDNKEYAAKIVGRDPRTDVAVLKVEASGLPAITLADSDKIEVGDTVLAVGNPFGLGQTVTVGIVSALGRQIPQANPDTLADFIQTDAAINPGNSGGALVDAAGRLIGINTAIFSGGGAAGNIGIGFAIPVNLARSVMDQLIKKGKVSRGLLGVSIRGLQPEEVEEFKVSGGQGALVLEVNPDSAAEKAGIKVGDVIVQAAGHPVKDSQSLRLTIASMEPGSRVTIRIVRDGKERAVEATLKEADAESADAGGGAAPGSGGTAPGHKLFEGVTLVAPTPEQRQALQLPDKAQGALVKEIDESSDAYDAGLRRGDLIVEVERQPVTKPADAHKAAASSGDNRYLLRLIRRGMSEFLIITLKN